MIDPNPDGAEFDFDDGKGLTKLGKTLYPRNFIKLVIQKKIGKVGQFSLKVTQLNAQRKAFLQNFGSLLNNDKKIATPAAHLSFAIKNIERIGDHATNIAEDISFILTADRNMHMSNKD